jgi:hypothetical protein
MALCALLAAEVSPGLAAEPVTGRWAADPAACGSFGAAQPLIVTETAVRWRDDACRIARMYKTGDTVHIQARCWSGGGEHSVPVSLRPHRGRLQLRWDRVSAGDLRRCR